MPTLFKGAAQIIIDPGGLNLTINRDQQSSDLTIEPTLTTSPLNSLASSDPVDYIQTAVSVKITIGIADMDIKAQILAMCCKATVAVDGAKRKVVAYDQAGTRSIGRKIIIKPYDGLLPSSNANDWFTIPNGKITDLSGTSLAYGLQTQQEIKVSFMAVPDSTGAKYIVGDETAAG